jgi:pimeloyl-ACP methyl ester carboxylesterase
MSTHTVSYNNFNLEYRIIGVSDQPVVFPIIAFHGFGRSADDFSVFEPLLRQGEVIYSFNLFGHGNSTFPADRKLVDSLSLSEFEELLAHILDLLNITRFSFLAYSLGGKKALIGTTMFAARIDRLILIAPDGIKVNKFYAFISGTSLGRWIYKKTTKNPKPIFWVTDGLNALGLLPDKLKKFVYHHMETQERRELVGKVWMIYRHFNPDIRKVQKLINQHRIQTLLIYGKYDNVIKPWQGEKFNAGLNQDALHILESGHLLVAPATVRYLGEKNLWKKE